MEYIDYKVIPEDVYKDYHNFHWLDEMGKDERCPIHFDDQKSGTGIYGSKRTGYAI